MIINILNLFCVSLLVLGSSVVVAGTSDDKTSKTLSEPEIFQVYIETTCSQLSEGNCIGFEQDVIKQTADGTRHYLTENFTRSITLDKLKPDLYMVKYSCGSPCHIYEFISPDYVDSDTTDSMVGFDVKNQCLLEFDVDYDTNTLILKARHLFSENSEVVYLSQDLDLFASIQKLIINDGVIEDNVFRMNLPLSEDFLLKKEMNENQSNETERAILITRPCDVIRSKLNND